MEAQTGLGVLIGICLFFLTHWGEMMGLGKTEGLQFKIMGAKNNGLGDRDSGLWSWVGG